MSDRRTPLALLRHAALAARSGLRRYPRALWHSALTTTPQEPHARHQPQSDHPWHDWDQATLAATWLGHGSVALRLGGLNVLIDPVFSQRIGLRIGSRTLGLPRLQPIPHPLHTLPSPDLILISHAHFDHLDIPTLTALASLDTTLVTARRTAGLIPPGFARVIEVDWRQTVHLRTPKGALAISALRPRHWGARTALDRRRGFNSYLLRDRDGRGALLAGDTAMTDAFDALRDVELAALGIGSYEPWSHVHATPEEAWAMFQASGARRLLPVHHSTFELGDEPPGEPLARLLAAAGHAAPALLDPQLGRVLTTL